MSAGPWSGVADALEAANGVQGGEGAPEGAQALAGLDKAVAGYSNPAVIAAVSRSPRREVIGAAELWLGDNAEIAPTLPRPDALVGDPPYGQRLNTNVMGAGGSKTYGNLGARGGAKVADRRAAARGGIRVKDCIIWPDTIHGDDWPFDPAPWLGMADSVLLWGAHKFADRLPPGSWLVWDKVPTGKVRDQGDGEAAWTSVRVPSGFRIYRLLWDGVCVGSAARDEVTAGQGRVHPTQKPTALMAWCLDQIGVAAGQHVLDPWMGAGSTGIAALQRGCPFTGIEIEPRYFDTACRRIEQAQRQSDLFVQVPA